MIYRYKYSCLYELDSLAVVNVRDLGGVKHAFKLLVFPEARLFAAANAGAKQEWMDAFETAKKRRQKEQETQALKRSDTITQRERYILKVHYRGTRLILTRLSGRFCPEYKKLSGLIGVVYSVVFNEIETILFLETRD